MGYFSDVAAILDKHAQPESPDHNTCKQCGVRISDDHIMCFTHWKRKSNQERFDLLRERRKR